MSKKISKFLFWSTAVLGSMTLYNIEVKNEASKITSHSPYNTNTYSGKFGKISYIKEGEGSPILLVHNLSSGDSNYEWNKIIVGLSHFHTVYAIDLPGCGKSEKTNIEYTNYMYALSINDFIKNAIIKTPIADLYKSVEIISSGKASSLVISSVSLESNLYSKITLVNPVSFSSTIDSGNKLISKLARGLFNLPIIGTFLYNLLYSKRKICDLFSSITNADIDENEKSQLVNTYYHNSHNQRGSKFIFSSTIGGLLCIDQTRMYSKLTTPITLIFGENKNDIEDIYNEYADNKEIITKKIISNSNCMPHIENPLEFIDAVK